MAQVTIEKKEKAVKPNDTQQKDVYSFPKNPLEEVRATVSKYKGKDYVSLRVWYKNDYGDFAPTPKGITVNADLIGELAAAIEALREAIDE